MRYDIAFYFVIDSQVSTTGSKKGQVDFAKEVVTKFSVGYMQTRFSCHLYGTTPTELFDFKSKSTVTGINDALDDFIDRRGSGSVETIENLKYIWTDIFTEIKGDRPDIPNYCLMIAIGENNDTYTLAGNQKPDTIDLRIYDAEAAYTHRNYYTDRQLAQTATKYITISSLSNFLSEAAVFTADFTCDYCKYTYIQYD